MSKDTTPLATCPSLEDLAAFAEGALPTRARDNLVAHLSTCKDCSEVLAGTMQVLEEIAPAVLPKQVTRPGLWIPLAAAAAGLFLVSAIVLLVAQGRRSPPSRTDWLAQMPPAQRLVPAMGDGVVQRGRTDQGTLAKQSAELGALLVDLDVSLAANDSDSAARIADRIASVLDAAGLVETPATRLRAAAAARNGPLGAIRAEMPGIEKQLRERFVPFYLDLGGFAEESRIAVAIGNKRFGGGASTRRYVAWLLAQRDEPIPEQGRRALTVLEDTSSGLSERRAATDSLWRSLTR